MVIQPGTVFWLTGLSGSGKTTIGTVLTEMLRKQSHAVLLLDGDNLREVTNNMFGHDRAERLRAGFLYARLCKMLAAQGLHVVCTTISLFHEIQEWNRSHIPNYLEVFIEVPLEVVMQRDPKNIYAHASKGLIKHVVGMDIQADFPKHADVIVPNDNSMKIETAVKMILEKFYSTWHSILSC